MIVTVSRQFGSGGRELGKRLSDELNLKYYDKEIVTAIAKQTSLNETYVNDVLENGGYKNFSFSFARTIPTLSSTPDTVTEVLVAQQNVIRAIGAQGNCLIVGRCADALLAKLNPFRIFVYADKPSKIARCRARAADGENFTDKQYEKTFKEIDKSRARLHDLVASGEWGDKAGYDLMINTSHTDINSIIPALAKYIKEHELT